jgi:hypothetical protein
MGRILAAGAAAALTWMTASPAAAVGDFWSGNWKGAAFFKDSRFSHCAMSADYSAGWRMFFTIERDGDVILGLHNSGLDIKRGSRSPVLMQIDDSPVITREFVAINPSLIGTTFTSNVEWFQRLRKGLRLKIKFGERVQNFSLKGTHEAMFALFACAAKFRNL